MASDFAANDTVKVWYRTSLLGSTLYAVDENGEVVTHMTYDPWGNPKTETSLDINYSGITNLNNFTGYTYDEVLDLYFAQNRFYDAETHRFTQEDVIKDGENWYVYCGNNPVVNSDSLGLFSNGDYLRYGLDNNKDDVIALQTRLKELGYYQYDIDGSFGLGTAAAVNEYKDKYLAGGNTGTNRGVVGYTTWTSLGLTISKPDTLAGGIPDAMFSWDSKQGIWYSETDAPQNYFGYNDSYDDMFTFGAIFGVSYKSFIFNYEDEDYWWRIEAWKGNYLNMGVGGEIGVYVIEKPNSDNNYFHNAYCEGQKSLENYAVGPTDTWLFMKMSLYNGKINQNLILERSWTTHWWLNGFKPDIGTISPNELNMVGFICFPSTQMADSFENKENLSKGPSGGDVNTNFSFSTERMGTMTVKFTWKG